MMVWFIRFFHQSRILNLQNLLTDIDVDFFFNWQTEKQNRLFYTYKQNSILFCNLLRTCDTIITFEYTSSYSGVVFSGGHVAVFNADSSLMGRH